MVLRAERTQRWTLPSAALLIALAGCGDDGGGTSAGSTEGGASTGGTTSQPTSLDTSLDTSGETAMGTSSTTDAGGVTTNDGETGSSSGVATRAETGATSTGTDTDQDTDTESGDGSSGGRQLPFPCDDEALPVHVVGGGDYATIAEGVFATPPQGTVQICPGEYTESDPVAITHDMTVVGAGSDLVSLTSTAAFSAGNFLGGAFEVEQANVVFEGLSVRGGRYGFFVYTIDDDAASTFRDVRVAATDDSAIYILHDALGGAPSVADVTLEDVVVEDVVGTEAFAAHSAVRLFRAAVTFTDSHILNNSTEFGGMHIEGSAVTFTGGTVHNNVSVDGTGGGAFLRDSGAVLDATLDIVDSDWGAGAAVENAPADVDCGLAADVGWLGAPANATCEVAGMCCSPT